MKYRTAGGEWRFREGIATEDAGAGAAQAGAQLALPVLECRLRLSREVLPHETPQLRGFFGRKFADEVRLHHHRPDGSLLYEYPRVQFKVINRVAVLLGLGDGSKLVARLWSEVEQARLGEEDLTVLEANMIWRPATLGATSAPVQYRFVTPWLALNQRNAQRYQQADAAGDRAALLERILVGNCLSLAKAFDHTVETRLTAHCEALRPVRTTLKGVPMIGFRGTFRINFRIPDLVGLGKSVSRGFGAVRGMEADLREEREE